MSKIMNDHLFSDTDGFKEIGKAAARYLSDYY